MFELRRSEVDVIAEGIRTKCFVGITPAVHSGYQALRLSLIKSGSDIYLFSSFCTIDLSSRIQHLPISPCRVTEA